MKDMVSRLIRRGWMVVPVERGATKREADKLGF